MTYSLAASLAQLRSQINARWPGRDKGSDGWIGDASHSARKSDHNPDWAAGGVVRALDVDKDGINPDAVTKCALGDNRVSYVIFQGEIWGGSRWRPYAGANRHDKHIHISIKHTKAAESGHAWDLAGEVKPAGSKPTPRPTARKKQLNSTRPDGNLVFPTDYEDLILDKNLGPITVGAFQILMEAVKIGVRYNQRWDGDWENLTIRDAMEWLQHNGFYLVTQHKRGKVAKGTKLSIDGEDGYWFWYELQRFLKSRGHYNKTPQGVALVLDGDPKGWTIHGFQRYINTQNGK